jgi:hypothetical protein
LILKVFGGETTGGNGASYKILRYSKNPQAASVLELLAAK